MPKFHLAWRISFFQRFHNARFTWAYKWVEYMGGVLLAASACLACACMGLLASKVLGSVLLVFTVGLRRRARVVRRGEAPYLRKVVEAFQLCSFELEVFRFFLPPAQHEGSRA